jgi:hypothetical protein
MVAFAILVATFKDSSFAEEAEWRLIGLARGDHKLKYREGLSFIIPFVEFDLGAHGERIKLNDVVVGPSPHNQLSQLALIHMFQTFNVNCRLLGPSRTPFRSW